MNSRRQKQREKRRNARNEERFFGTIYDRPDPTAKAAIISISKKQNTRHNRV